MTTTETMKLALEALNKNVGELRVAGARHILKTAIKQAENQDAWKTSDTAYRPGGLPQDVQAEEPVAWLYKDDWGRTKIAVSKETANEWGTEVRPLVFGDTTSPAAPLQEPVYKVTVVDDQHPNGVPLDQWATPPAAQRTWVGLTDADKREFAAAQHGWEDLLAAAEAKLKEKNT